MKFRHKFLIGRVIAFASLLATASVTSVVVADTARDDRQTSAAPVVEADHDDQRHAPGVTLAER